MYDCNDLLGIAKRWKNLINSVELVGIVEGPPPVGGGGVGVNFAVNLKDLILCPVVPFIDKSCKTKYR